MTDQKDSFGNFSPIQTPQAVGLAGNVSVPLSGLGNPNGVVTSFAGSTYFDYQNNIFYGTDDGTTWVALTTGGGGFPTLSGNNNFTGTANTFSGSVTSKVYNGTQQSIGASNIDWSTGTHFFKTIAANTVFTFSNSSDTETIVVAVTGDASHTVTWPVAVKWSGGTSPTQTLSKTDIYTFLQVNGTVYGSAVQNF